MIWLGSLLFNIVFYSWTALIVLIFTPPAALFGPPRAIFVLGRFWAKVGLFLLRIFCGITHRVTGLENLPDRPFLLASKHQSAWDTLIFSQILDNPSYVLKRELTYIPFFGWALIRVGMVAVDRSGGAAALKKMVAAAQERLKEGRSIVIYPEGTRVAPGVKQRYHPGIAALYKELEIPVVPVALNSGLFWGRKRFMKQPGIIDLAILPAIPPGLPRRQFMAELEDQIETTTQRLCETGP